MSGSYRRDNYRPRDDLRDSRRYRDDDRDNGRSYRDDRRSERQDDRSFDERRGEKREDITPRPDMLLDPRFLKHKAECDKIQQRIVEDNNGFYVSSLVINFLVLFVVFWTLVLFFSRWITNKHTGKGLQPPAPIPTLTQNKKYVEDDDDDEPKFGGIGVGRDNLDGEVEEHNQVYHNVPQAKPAEEQKRSRKIEYYTDAQGNIVDPATMKGPYQIIEQ